MGDNSVRKRSIQFTQNLIAFILRYRDVAKLELQRGGYGSVGRLQIWREEFRLALCNQIMFDTYRLKNWISWPLIRAHLCTLAVAVSFNSTWRAPRDGYRYGGLAYAMVLTVAMVTIALPVTLLQLAVGQLSQQDAVGVWRAVPFFKGVGYLRLLISFIGSVYTVIQVALLVTYFLYTLSNSIPFLECTDLVITEDGYENLFNGTTCINATFLAPVSEQAEYYAAVSLVIIVLWIVFPFLLFSPVKMMKRTFYLLGPVVIILFIVVASNTADGTNLSLFQTSGDWRSFQRPNVWFGAVTQALLSSQVAGGYLVSAGDTVYASTDVQWSAVAIVGANMVASWGGLLFWFAVGGGDKDTSPVAPLVQMYQAAADNQFGKVWPLLAFAALFFSGIITMLTLLYPLYIRYRRIGGYKWRLVCVANSLVSIAAALAVLAGRLPAMSLLEDVAVPLLIAIATVLEITAFIFIYGWKVLVEDVEFLTGEELKKFWVFGWCGAPGIIAPFAIWWVVLILLDGRWTEEPWDASGVCAVASVAIFVFLLFGAVVVARQVQYDIIGKLKSSFQPSRHWGPRDPITHYYWLARREEIDRGPRMRYQRRRLGQMSGSSSIWNTDVVPNSSKEAEIIADTKRRTNSDDWLYTVCRRKYLEDVFIDIFDANKRRSKSLDWSDVVRVRGDGGRNYTKSLDSFKENNNNVDIKKYVIDNVLK